MLGREEENAGVSNSNKSLNAEQFLPLLPWSVDLITNLKTGLCSVASAAGKLVQSSDYPLHFFPHDGVVCPGTVSSWTVRRYFPAAPWPVTTAWPPCNMDTTHIHRAVLTQIMTDEMSLFPPGVPTYDHRWRYHLILYTLFRVCAVVNVKQRCDFKFPSIWSADRPLVCSSDAGIMLFFIPAPHLAGWVTQRDVSDPL